MKKVEQLSSCARLAVLKYQSLGLMDRFWLRRHLSSIERQILDAAMCSAGISKFAKLDYKQIENVVDTIDLAGDNLLSKYNSKEILPRAVVEIIEKENEGSNKSINATNHVKEIIAVLYDKYKLGEL
ncbi:hypothetical protein [Microbulbifer sp. TYP-18]|uniref:hypothetical protein n=1 Tax=Microbulbifer sp. TYP-18 TaxID=3230024 RepID=UPI0034C6BD09